MLNQCPILNVQYARPSAATEPFGSNLLSRYEKQAADRNLRKCLPDSMLFMARREYRTALRFPATSLEGPRRLGSGRIGLQCHDGLNIENLALIEH